MTDLLHLYFTSSQQIVLEVSVWLILLALFVLALFLAYRRWTGQPLLHRFELVEAEIQLGGVGKVTLRPNLQDIQIAHKVWSELVTRKAAIPIDEDNDVIIEIYNSWYAMFLEVRKLISQIPASLLRSQKSTQEIVRITTTTLNEGLRPHLTKWHARFRNWYEQHRDELKEKTPQELQREYPGYEELMADLRKVNQELIGYAGALYTIARGK